MTDTPQLQTQQQIFEYAMNLYDQGQQDFKEIETALINNGVALEKASSTVIYLQERLADDVKRVLDSYDEALKQADKYAMRGLFWFVGGILVTAVSFAAAAGGGSYVLAWGAIIFGIMQFFKGRYLSDQIKTEKQRALSPNGQNKNIGDDYPSNLDERCQGCANYDNQSGVCSKIHENIKSYPQKFVKKCAGQYFIAK